jgi:hypothetical protein
LIDYLAKILLFVSTNSYLIILPGTSETPEIHYDSEPLVCSMYIHVYLSKIILLGLCAPTTTISMNKQFDKMT